MLERLPIDLIVEIGILAGPDEYEELAKTSKRNAIILQKPYIIKTTNALIVKVTFHNRDEYCYDGEEHSFNDQPGIFFHDGSKMWYQHGYLHRDNDQPAIIYSNGIHKWYQHGRCIEEKWYHHGRYI
jgi:hypothetical protein